MDKEGEFQMKIIQWISTNKPINIFGYECSLYIPEYVDEGVTIERH